MKRMLFRVYESVFLVFMLMVSKGYCGFDPTYNLSNRIWQSSVTSSYNTNVRIASGACILWNVKIDSAGVGSLCEFFNGNTSSGTATRITNGIDTTKTTDGFPYGIYCSSGLIYNNIISGGGTVAKIVFFWDWLVVPGQTP